MFCFYKPKSGYAHNPEETNYAYFALFCIVVNGM
jgi:hypothetical protein